MKMSNGFGARPNCLPNRVSGIVPAKGVSLAIWAGLVMGGLSAADAQNLSVTAPRAAGQRPATVGNPVAGVLNRFRSSLQSTLQPGRNRPASHVSQLSNQAVERPPRQEQPAARQTATPHRTASSDAPAFFRQAGGAGGGNGSRVVQATATQVRPNRSVGDRNSRRTTGTGSSIRQQIDQVYQAASQAKSVQDIQQALQSCRDLHSQQLDPENRDYLLQLQAWLLNRRGEAYSQAAMQATETGKHQAAIDYEQKAQRDFQASLKQHPHWRAYHNLGVSRAMTGEYDVALDHFSEAIRLNPEYANTRFNRAELHLELGHYEAAERDYSHVLRLNPQDTDSRIGRGHARFYLGQPDKALQDFDQVVSQDPGHATALADRADLHAYLGNWQAAAEDYRQAISIDKQMGRAWQSAAWLMATCPEEPLRNELAVSAAERAIQLDGTDDYRYLDTLAAAHANAGDFPKALDVVQRAIQVAPNDVRAELQERQALYQANRPYRDVR